MICWIDLETTGLNSKQDKILEIACIITDDKLVEIDRWQAVTCAAQYVSYNSLHTVVRDMHFGNGLWMESLRSNLPPGGGADSADAQLREFIAWHCTTLGEKKGPVLAGSTVSFDREFMRSYLPESFAALHYRNLDVTSVNELAKRFWPKVYEGRPRAGSGAAHRAMLDIEESLNVARYYAGALGPVV